MQAMAASVQDRGGEIRNSLKELVVAHYAAAADDYRGTCVRRISDPIPLVDGEPGTEGKIGEVELISFDASRAVDRGLDIVDVAGSAGEEEYR